MKAGGPMITSSDEAHVHTITVMVIDDERDVRESVAEMLLASGYRVMSASHGRDALDRLRKGSRPDVILLDLVMPVMNGWQFREEQSNDPDLAGIPVLVVTANRELREIPADEVLYKPVRPEKLLKAVERWADRARAQLADAAVTAKAPDLKSSAPAVKRASVTRAAEADGSSLFSERFVEMLGHDLRNPLSAISITGGLLTHQARTSEVGESTARILSIVDRMDLMISHLLDFLRLSLGREIPLSREPLDLMDVCERVVRSTPSGGHQIEVVVDGATEGTWDRKRLELLLSTLITESCDADQTGGAIHVNAGGLDARIARLEVTHRGAASVDLLSRPVNAANTGEGTDVEEEYTRLGLGLYIAKQIVLAHEGELRVESDDANGTRFVIELPRNSSP
jgi:signal transduction histidine kinase